MKTIEEFATELSDKELPKITDGYSHGLKIGIEFGVEKGVEFAESWIPVTEELPTCFESGDWDGKRSGFVIARYKDGDWAKARLYSGIIDGHEFNDWANEEDCILCNIIIGWRPINRK